MNYSRIIAKASPKYFLRVSRYKFEGCETSMPYRPQPLTY